MNIHTHIDWMSKCWLMIKFDKLNLTVYVKKLLRLAVWIE